MATETWPWRTVSGKVRLKIEQFLHIVDTLREELGFARRVYEDRIAPDFSLFDFIEIDEPRVSAIIAWLLNPEGSHGQHGRFLHLFMQQLGVDWTASQDGHVRSEKVIPQGRLDIYIKTPAGVVALENKIGAADGSTQLCRYVGYLKSTVLDYRLIYLNPFGQDPEETSIPRELKEAEVKDGRLHVWSYDGNILPWLQQCQNVCAADKVRMFIADFEKMIQKTVLGVKDVAETDPLVDMLTRTPEMIASAMHVIVAGPKLRLALLDRLAEQVRDHPRAKAWKVSETWRTERELLIDFRSDWSYWFTIGFEQVGWKAFYYGIKLKPGRPRSAIGAVAQRFSRGRSTESWPWYRLGSIDNPHLPYEAGWEATERPWLAIAKGEMVEQVVQLAAEMEEALRESGPETASGSP